jgi:hypothetical protein
MKASVIDLYENAYTRLGSMCAESSSGLLHPSCVINKPKKEFSVMAFVAVVKT